MFKSYLKTALRNLLRQKNYALTNIFGLTLGMLGFLIITIWVWNELGYDQFHEKKERIFRVNTRFAEGGILTSSSWRLGPALKAAYPEIQNYTRVWTWARSLMRYEDKTFDEQNVYLADSSFFTIFSFPFLKGNPETALKDKYSIVLTEATAQRYFADGEPIGKVLHSRHFDRGFKVAGVIENIPTNSHLKFDIMARVDLMPQQRLQSWEFTGYTYVLLCKGANEMSTGQKIAPFYKTYVNSETDAVPVLQPLTQIHLYASGKPELIKQIYLFSIIAVFVLLIACVNFMNLSTARSIKRAKEVGIRKVAGAQRSQLIGQFLGESLLISLMAMVLAILLLEIFLPLFNRFTANPITIPWTQFPSLGLLLIGITLVTGIVAGSYPALFLSTFRPSQVFKENITPYTRSKTLRKMLIIFQFTISVALIICTFLVHSQIQFIQNKNLGLDREQIVWLKNNPDLNDSFDAYRSELMREPGIESVTASATRPIDVGQFIGVNWEGHLDEEEIGMAYTMVDYDFFETFQMKMRQGRAFSRDFVSDETEACIINETALAQMQLDDPIGKQLYFNHPAFEEAFKQVKIIGVVNDFHYRSLHQEIGPFVFRIYRPWHSYVFLKLTSERIMETMLTIEHITKKFAPDYPFQFEFLDETYRQLYEAEIRMGRIFNAFSVFAILISCLGLLGLTSYTIEQRTKEIGIRRVLGASLTNLVLILTRDFSRGILVAILLACPIALYTMHRWLQNFAYRITIEWWIFLLAGLGALIIAWLTVGYHVVRAALANPVKALRYE